MLPKSRSSSCSVLNFLANHFLDGLSEKESAEDPLESQAKVLNLMIYQYVISLCAVYIYIKLYIYIVYIYIFELMMTSTSFG